MRYNCEAGHDKMVETTTWCSALVCVTRGARWSRAHSGRAYPDTRLDLVELQLGEILYGSPIFDDAEIGW
jgi:hypothetical protein